MEDKQKVTLYLPHQIYRQLKIRAVMDGETMSSMVEKALAFYLQNPDVVDGVENHGKTHQVYNCPECEHPLVLKEEQLVALGQQPGVVAQELTNVGVVEETSHPMTLSTAIG